MENTADVVHRLIDLAVWPTEDERDKAHSAVTAQPAPPTPVSASKPSK